MDINARLAKMIFEQNPDHDFYIEESFPLDWMYPHLQPFGIIMKLQREKIKSIMQSVLSFFCFQIDKTFVYVVFHLLFYLFSRR